MVGGFGALDLVLWPLWLMLLVRFAARGEP
jgi:hypothetical protein